MAEEQIYYATGKRKSSAARVFLKQGSGKITVNKKPSNEYVETIHGRALINQPFAVTDLKGRFDAYVTVTGGGTSGQAEAIRHGISRALLAFDPELRGKLKKAGLLTRDAREVERKKYGLHKARKSTQFSKR